MYPAVNKKDKFSAYSLQIGDTDNTQRNRLLKEMMLQQNRTIWWARGGDWRAEDWGSGTLLNDQGRPGSGQEPEGE